VNYDSPRVTNAKVAIGSALDSAFGRNNYTDDTAVHFALGRLRQVIGECPVRQHLAPEVGIEMAVQEIERLQAELEKSSARIAKMSEVLDFVEGRLSDLPLASRTPEERLAELEGWISDEILPMCSEVLGRTP
jgi:hypothetical protein